MPIRASRLALLAFPLMLAACSEAPGEGGDAAEAETEVSDEDEAAGTLDLQATGLVIPPQGGFEQYDIPFGSNRGATEATVGQVAGGVVERSEAPECGAGPMQVTQFEGLTLYFQEERFVGYFAEEPFVGEMPRAEMLGVEGVQLLEDSTLGEEFTIGDREGQVISGLFDGEGDGALVSSLWAGMTCNAR